MYRYKYVVSGGTFDHFHAGHKAFLQEQLSLSEKVLIGVTSDAYIQKNKEKSIESFANRVESLKKFFLFEKATNRVEIQKIDTYAIPKIWEKYPIEAIVVTEDTKTGANRINAQREKNGESLFHIHTVAYIQAEDGKSITSSRIRNGEIDREGNLFIDPKWLNGMLLLPPSLREEVSQPFGIIFKTIDLVLQTMHIDPAFVVTVGDVVTEGFMHKTFGQKVAIVDLFVKRQKEYASLSDHTIYGDEVVISVKNPATNITAALFNATKKSIFEQGKYIILIDGEEDLAVLPFILTCPLGFCIIYGQPSEGVVVIIVTENTKKKAKELLNKFTFLGSE